MQEASGNPPPSGLSAQCAVVTVSPDYSAFHITVYGGWSLSSARSFETVYVLSVPSFTWINVTQTSLQSNTEAAVNSTIGRDSASCQLYNGALMIDLGGEIRNGADSLTNGACSETFEPVQVLDLSTYQWQSSLDMNVEYQVPPAIYSVIGGKYVVQILKRVILSFRTLSLRSYSANGGATSTIPQGGFADATLSSILQQRVPRATSTSSSNSTKTPQAPATTSKSSPPQHNDTGAIAGGVVGGVLGLAIVMGTAWLFWRRRTSGKRDAAAGYDDKQDVATPPAEMEARHLNELHGYDRVPEADDGQVYEIADTQQPAELGEHAAGRDEKKPVGVEVDL